MPLPLIPFLLGGAALAAGGHGVKKGIEGHRDMEAAKSINRKAQSVADKAEKLVKDQKEKTTASIENLGAQKIKVLSGSISDFVATYETIKGIQLESSEGVEELKHFSPQSPEFLQLKKVSMQAKEVAANGIGAIGSGALLAYGTYHVVMGGLGGLLVTATTGTALSSLSGVAATNATLAWLGGGALSAGGLGMAGGMAVLGGLVVGPALALGGSLFAKQADKAYWSAKSNLEQAETFKKQADSIFTTLVEVKTRADQLTELICRLDQPLQLLNSDMRGIVRNYGTNWSAYSAADKKRIYMCVQTAQRMKQILDTLLLKEDGSLCRESAQALDQGCAYLKELKV